MYKVEALLVFESLQDLNGKASNEVLSDSFKVVLLDKFVKIEAQQLKSHDKMASENHVVLHSDDVVGILSIVVVQELQDLELHTCLILEFLLVLHQLQSDYFIIFVIFDLDNLPKASIA